MCTHKLSCWRYYKCTQSILWAPTSAVQNFQNRDQKTQSLSTARARGTEDVLAFKRNRKTFGLNISHLDKGSFLQTWFCVRKVRWCEYKLSEPFFVRFDTGRSEKAFKSSAAVWIRQKQHESIAKASRTNCKAACSRASSCCFSANRLALEDRRGARDFGPFLDFFFWPEGPGMGPMRDG